jgi:hypothetical protein
MPSCSYRSSVKAGGLFVWPGTHLSPLMMIATYGCALVHHSQEFFMR